jgi:hypothetical protein
MKPIYDLGKHAKIYDQRRHAKKRARQRYGVTLSTRQLYEIAQKIINGDSQFVERGSCRVSKHLVQYQGMTFYVAYDSNRKSVCSFLPSPVGEKAQ